MNSSKKYYISIDIIRIIACISIFLYHLNILKGGYLAVCTFFCLSGYLSCISALKKDKFSLKKYYINRILKLYLPLIIVVFITIVAVNIFSNILWLNLKPETTSVLLGYNNFWQLGANLDYFARHINSPFMHFWYISILLQFDLIFPLIYIFLRKLESKFNKILPCMITIILSVVMYIYFYKVGITQNIMVTYYNTFTRLFSILFGVSLGFMHTHDIRLIPKKIENKYVSKLIFIMYLIILEILFIYIDANSPYFLIAMLLSTIVTCRLIDYGKSFEIKNIQFISKIIKFLSSISYEVYLVQYPVIFLFQNININCDFKLHIMIIIIFIISYILHLCTNFSKNEKGKIVKYFIRIILLLITISGIFQYIMAEDHTEEMKQLEQQLAENAEIIEQKQKEYELQYKQEQDNWIATLKDLENGENELKNVVSKLPVVGIGDSVMLGAVGNLYATFPNGYFDAAISRTAWVAKGILNNLENRNLLGNPIIINLGANGDCTEECKIEIIEKCKEREIFWINVTNDKDVNVNADLVNLSFRYNNLHVIDWNNISKGHPEYFIADGIHLTEIGKQVYTRVIYDAIYQEYLKEYNKNKEEIINKYQEDQKNKISFYGNEILLNAFDYIQSDYSGAQFNINKDYNYETLKQDILKALQNNTLTHKVVLAFDNYISLNLSQYEELIKLCDGHEIYILSLNEQFTYDLSKLNYQNVKIINFYQEILNNNGYLMVDKVHLSEQGNLALSQILNSNIKKRLD